MTETSSIYADVIFAFVLMVTLAISLYARRVSSRQISNEKSDSGLNKWLIGLSAGAAANSGFIVTGAVGLGYGFGVQWILLPLSWLIGDAVFWILFPHRINSLGKNSGANTISELLTFDLKGNFSTIISKSCAAIILLCLSGYIASQWIAGQKFLAGALGFSELFALICFALFITVYSSIGGFLGSVYTDAFQAILRIVGTAAALGAVVYYASSDHSEFYKNISAAGHDFLSIFPSSLPNTIGFILGFAFAAIGFGLGQPQIISRYLAGSTPDETRAAWWIYIGFVQFTWISMTLFGVLLRGVMPNLSDPEAGLSVFFKTNLGPILTGLITADVFATIAATSNALLVACSQAIVYDILKINKRSAYNGIGLASATVTVGAITMIVSFVINTSVMAAALSSISILGAALSAPVFIKVMRLEHSAKSLVCAMYIALVTAVSWRLIGLSSAINEAIIGFVVGISANYIFLLISDKRGGAIV